MKLLIALLLGAAVAAAALFYWFSGPHATQHGDAAREVRVAAAADLKFALQEVVAAFHDERPDVRVAVTYGASGEFYAQLNNRAPYDLFLSADMDYPRRLVEAGLADKDSEFRYAVGHLVVWVPRDSPLDVERLRIEALLDPSVKKIAIANPRHAPYGRAAEAALKNLGVYEKVRDRLVLGENIAQAAQFAQSGAADAGVIALSLALSPSMRDAGKFWPVPADSFPRLDQGGVILNGVRDREAADAFRAFLMSSAGKAVLRRFGFDSE
jgi:molybdate transport system substrate-binding protein